MTTFNSMVAKIADDMQRGDLTTQIGREINRAIRYYYNLDPFYFNEATGTFTTVQGQQIYTSTNTGITDISALLWVKIAINSSWQKELNPRTFQYIQEYNINATQGQPFDYAYYNESFYLYPVPNDAYTVTVYYNKTFADLSGEQENAFTTQAEDLIEARVRWALYMHAIQNPEAAKMAKEEEMDALQALRIATADIASTGFVRPIKF